MNTGKDKIKVAIAEDEAYTRQLMQSYLDSFSQVEVVASVKSGKELIDVINQVDPTAVFLDIEMPEINGLSTAALLKEKKKDIRWRHFLPTNDSGGGFIVKILAFISGISRVPNRTNQVSLSRKGLC
ncbi:MAG: Transcriptional regulatory protein YehT [Pelotomaculum sp. PtaB.Bin104]|uniref:Stage 0 sporulation protein A homolog n=1 Tax=Pelotomaculum isophthalicicum JI TaxID=947010 RepID=A0A9X4JUU9_9FIRM|nr:response regulator [Pelotomaculum isophthalicicum]MDF9409895.1 response regulator [Pelotomaculum isophthalicicum JI]OPX91701.1 MAG: Transcriptional regulatory protein YehT [Pelotomaculum sp. PtaB.Bin104]